MAVARQLVTDKFALYNGDAVEGMSDLPDGSIHFSHYSSPFASEGRGPLYHYGSDPRDLSNSADYREFFEHFEHFAQELHRVTMKGRVTMPHCCDIVNGNSGVDTYTDFPGDLIRLYKKVGWDYGGRHIVWRNALDVRNATMVKALFHKNLCEDSAAAGVAVCDQVLVFRKPGENPVPVAHPTGLLDYAGSEKIPAELLARRGMKGNQIYNDYSQWIWQRYAAGDWRDIRYDRCLPKFEDPDDESFSGASPAHPHPLPLDIAERSIQLKTNPGEVVLDPFHGVGSVPYSAVIMGRIGMGWELKPGYYSQSEIYVQAAADGKVFDDENRQTDIWAAGG